METKTELSPHLYEEIDSTATWDTQRKISKQWERLNFYRVCSAPMSHSTRWWQWKESSMSNTEYEFEIILYLPMIHIINCQVPVKLRPDYPVCNRLNTLINNDISPSNPTDITIIIQSTLIPCPYFESWMRCHLPISNYIPWKKSIVHSLWPDLQSHCAYIFHISPKTIGVQWYNEAQHYSVFQTSWFP